MLVLHDPVKLGTNDPCYCYISFLFTVINESLRVPHVGQEMLFQEYMISLPFGVHDFTH